MSATGSAQHRRSLWLAALLTSLIVPFGYFAVVGIIVMLSGGSLGSEELARGFGYILLFGFPFFLSAIVLLGMPALLLLRNTQRLTGVNTCIAAALAGIVAAALLMVLDWPSMHASVLAIGLATGLAAGFIFALIAGIRFRRST